MAFVQRSFPDTLGGRLARARRTQGMAQSAAARALGVSLRCLGLWEQGATEPRASDLLRLALLYKVAPSTLLGVTTEPGGIAAPAESEPGK